MSLEAVLRCCGAAALRRGLLGRSGPLDWATRPVTSQGQARLQDGQAGLQDGQRRLQDGQTSLQDG